VNRRIARIAALVVMLHSSQTLLCDMICAPAMATQGTESRHCAQHATTSPKLSAGAARCDHSGEIDRFTALATTKLTIGPGGGIAVLSRQTIAAVFHAPHAVRSDSPPTGPPRVTTLQQQVLRV
jgi:hypothetical protein